MPLSSLEHLIKNATINENNVVGNDFNDPAAATSNDYIHSEASIDDCLSQSPLNLTRSQGSLGIRFFYTCTIRAKKYVYWQLLCDCRLVRRRKQK